MVQLCYVELSHVQISPECQSDVAAFVPHIMKKTECFEGVVFRNFAVAMTLMMTGCGGFYLHAALHKWGGCFEPTATGWYRIR